MEDKLEGLMVLVHPEVYFDSERGHGFVGTIQRADVEADKFYVDLGGEEPRLFASDWLMTLQERSVLFDAALFDNLDKRSVTDLYRICLHMDRGQTLFALLVASANSEIYHKALVTLENQLKVGRSHGR